MELDTEATASGIIEAADVGPLVGDSSKAKLFDMVKDLEDEPLVGKIIC